MRLVLASYSPLFRVRDGRRIILAGFVGRLPPVGLVPLGLVLTVAGHSGSYGVAGATSGAAAAAGAVTGPLKGRALDALGQSRVLAISGAVNIVGLVTVLLSARAHAPTPVIVAGGALVGIGTPPFSACVRAIWKALLPDKPTLERAYAFEAMVHELCATVGPLLCGLVILIATPDAALVIAAVLVALGCVSIASASVSHSASAAAAAIRGGGVSPLRTVDVQILAGICALIGAGFGFLDVALPAYAADRSGASLAGLLLACLAVGSFIGGTWYGSRHWERPVAGRWVVLVGLSAMLALPLALAPPPVVMILLAFLAGLPVAPTFSCLYSLVDLIVHEARSNEAFSLMITANLAGISAGAACAGVVVEQINLKAALAAPALVTFGAAVGASAWVARRAGAWHANLSSQ